MITEDTVEPLEDCHTVAPVTLTLTLFFQDYVTKLKQHIPTVRTVCMLEHISHAL